MAGKKLLYVLLLFCTILSHAFTVNAQALKVNPPTVTFNINTQTLYANGTSLSYAGHLSRKLSIVTANNSATLTVNATSSSFSNGSQTIPLNNVSLQVTGVTSSLGMPVTFTSSVVYLSSSPQQLSTISNINALLNATLSISLKYTVIGGTGLLVPGGTYNTALTFSFVRTGKTSTGIVNPLSLVLSDVSSLSLQSSGKTATLTFSTALNYANGIQLVQPDALNIFCNQPYSVSLKAATNLNNGINSIPIANVMLQATPNPLASGITTSPVPITVTAQNIVTSTKPALSQYFDLKYFTSPGNQAFIRVPVGTYTTTLTYTLTAP